MVFLVLLLGPLAVRLLASIIDGRPRLVRAILPTAIAVGIGLWALSIPLEAFTDDDPGNIMSLIDTLFCVPALWAVGATVAMVTLGYSGEGSFWNEYFTVGNVSYGSWDVGLGLYGDILYATFLGMIGFAILLFIFYPALPYIYFGAQAIVLIKALLTRD